MHLPISSRAQFFNRWASCSNDLEGTAFNQLFHRKTLDGFHRPHLCLNKQSRRISRQFYILECFWNFRSWGWEFWLSLCDLALPCYEDCLEAIGFARKASAPAPIPQAPNLKIKILLRCFQQVVFWQVSHESRSRLQASLRLREIKSLKVCDLLGTLLYNSQCSPFD